MEVLKNDARCDIILFSHPLEFLFSCCRYTTDGGSKETLQKGTVGGEDVFSGEFIVHVCFVDLERHWTSQFCVVSLCSLPLGYVYQ